MTKSLLLALLCVLLSAYTALAGTNAEGKLLLGAAHTGGVHTVYHCSFRFPHVITTHTITHGFTDLCVYTVI